MPPKRRVFRVLNPNNLDPDIRIIAGNYGGREYQWFAGDDFIPPPSMPDEDIAWLRERGLIEIKESAPSVTSPEGQG
ncbi:MAG: hypothetical protein ACE5Q6_07945 [Dehalococcoidia bacterium]